MHMYADWSHIGSIDGSPERHILVMVDQATKYIVCGAGVSQSGKETAALMHTHWIRPYSPPEAVTTDNGPGIRSAEVSR